jgi:hypothetical protein
MSSASNEFLDSTPFIDRLDVLKANLKRDSYLFFRGLLNRAPVEALRAEILRGLASIGWLDESADPLEAQPGATPHFSPGRRNEEAALDRQWYDGYKLIQALEDFHALAHQRPLVDLMGRLLSGELVVHPRKIARVSFPGIEYPTPPHQDYNFNEATPDVLTAWVPLGSISRRLNGLQILRGSARNGPLEARPGDGVGGERVDVDDESPDWQTADYATGDVLIFHSFTVHRALPNRGDRLRLSADYRYQSADDPIKPDALQPHGYGKGFMPSWRFLSASWSSLSWIEVAHPVRIIHSVVGRRMQSRLIEADEFTR